MKFNYQARTKTGDMQTGVVEASSQEVAINLLKSHQLYVTAIEEVAPPVYARDIKFLRRISKREIVIFSRQLAIMFKSEIPVVETLLALAKQTKNSFFREKILKMAEKVEGGNSLSKTFALYPEIFSSFYVNMVKSGESSGKLSEIFEYLADYQEKEHDLYGKIRGAMIYPAFILLVFIVILVAMNYFVVPKLNQFLSETNVTLPLVTRIFFSFSNLLRQWGWRVALVFIALGVGLFFYTRSREGKNFFDKNLLKVPLIGDFLKKFYLARFALNLSILISGGLPIIQAMEITANVVGSEVYKKIILDTAEGVKKGEQISAILEKYPQLVSPLFVQMVTVGERTGRLDSALMNIVEFNRKEVEQALDNLVRLMEPALIAVFGIIVAILMIAIVRPLMQIVTSGF